MDYTYPRLEGRLMMATAIFRDLSISGHDRWGTNERAKANLGVEKSALRCVSAWPLRSQRTIIGLVLRSLQRTHGFRASLTALRAPALRSIHSVFEQFGGGAKYEV
jgi:hypothetical protein